MQTNPTKQVKKKPVPKAAKRKGPKSEVNEKGQHVGMHDDASYRRRLPQYRPLPDPHVFDDDSFNTSYEDDWTDTTPEEQAAKDKKPSYYYRDRINKSDKQTKGKIGAKQRISPNYENWRAEEKKRFDNIAEARRKAEADYDAQDKRREKMAPESLQDVKNALRNPFGAIGKVARGYVNRAKEKISDTVTGDSDNKRRSEAGRAAEQRARAEYDDWVKNNKQPKRDQYAYRQRNKDYVPSESEVKAKANSIVKKAQSILEPAAKRAKAAMEREKATPNTGDQLIKRQFFNDEPAPGLAPFLRKPVPMARKTQPAQEFPKVKVTTTKTRVK